MSRKPVYQRGECMSHPDSDVLLLKGNLTAEEFNERLAYMGHAPYHPADIQHGWHRCEQQGDMDEDYGFILQPVEPHARGAFEATFVEPWRVRRRLAVEEATQ